jgi:ABC-type multidrug transport system fused ATPase/permease subunit
MAKEVKRKVSGDEIKNALSIYRFILPYKWQFIIGLVCLVVSTSVVAIIPVGFGKLIDAATLNSMKGDKLLEIGLILGPYPCLFKLFFRFSVSIYSNM